MSTWRFVLQELGSNSTPAVGDMIGEVVNAYDRRVALALNGVSSASFRIRLDNPMADEITSRDGDVLLKVYQGSTLRFIGDCTTMEEVSGDSGVSLACNFAGPLWRLQKRLCGKNSSGVSFTDVDRAQILVQLLNEANLDSLGGETGIRWGGAGSTDVLSVASAGPWYYKPVAEAMSEIATMAVPFYVAKDDFTGAMSTGTPTGFLTDRVAPIGGTWSSTGDSGDFWATSAFSPDIVLTRTISSDPTFGRWGICGTTNYTDVLVSVDWCPTVDGRTAGYQHYGGVFARFTDTSNYLVAVHDLLAGTVALNKCTTAGGDVNLGTYTYVAPANFSANTWYRISLHVDSAGNYTVYQHQVGYPATAVITGQHADLATGGTLETGKIGINDRLNTGAFSTRYYNDFYATDPTQPVYGLDFEMVPVEPQLVGGVDVVKIATMNVKSKIGTATSAVFEYGDGNHSMTGYRRAVSREGLVNQGFSLPPDFPSNADVRTTYDQTSVTARGLFEEVIPSDVVSGELRLALVTAHVGVRKIARHLVTFEPSSTAPVFGTDYVVGDTVTGRAKVNGTSRFNGTFRVYGVEITIDDEGKDVVVPTLVPE